MESSAQNVVSGVNVTKNFTVAQGTTSDTNKKHSGPRFPETYSDQRRVFPQHECRHNTTLYTSTGHGSFFTSHHTAVRGSLTYAAHG
jgi:hypothetical protein